MSVKQPRLRYRCPQCKRCVLSVYTAAQHSYETKLPVAEYDGLQPSQKLAGAHGVYSSNTDRLRAKGTQVLYLAPDLYNLDITPDDIAVVCRGCGGKYSVMVNAILEDFRNRRKRDGVLPTR